MSIDRQNIEAKLPREATAAFCAAWGVAELYVFGSAARGDLEPSSDIDIAVRFRPGVRYSLFDLVDVKDELARISGRPVDLFTLRGIEHMANVERRRAILTSLELVHACVTWCWCRTCCVMRARPPAPQPA